MDRDRSAGIGPPPVPFTAEEWQGHATVWCPGGRMCASLRLFRWSDAVAHEGFAEMLGDGLHMG